jgi:hypothetical protein
MPSATVNFRIRLLRARSAYSAFFAVILLVRGSVVSMDILPILLIAVALIYRGIPADRHRWYPVMSLSNRRR